MRTNLQGAIYLARKTIESDIFFNKPDKWYKIWTFLLLMANHQDNKQFKRGECFTEYKEIKYYTGAKLTQIDHCIRWLKSATMITTRKATRGFYINITNYDYYQMPVNYKYDTKSDTESDTKSELEAKQKRNRSDTINNNDNNDNKDKQSATPTPSNLKQITDFFYKAVENKTGKKPELRKKDFGILQAHLKSNDLEKTKKIISWYINHPKFKEFPTLSACLSSHSINLFNINGQQDWQSK